MFTINRRARNATIYALKRIIVILIVVLVALIAFSITFNQFRVRTFVNDAFTARVDAILENSDNEVLRNFFDENFLAQDSLLNENRYSYYEVSKYDYKLEINRLSVGWIAPNRATVILSEYVTDIKGQFLGSSYEKIGMRDVPPEWENARYEVKLRKFDGRWYIVSMEKVKDLK